MTQIIAMWSGPRNLSTAMMRSFGARADCKPMDEPFYAAYLAATGLDHPMREEIIADGETDPQRVMAQCLEPPQTPQTITYQKHMTHHMVDGIPLDWLAKVTNVFLIRDPARVLWSYAAKANRVTAADTGFARQRELFDRLLSLGGKPSAVVDAADIRADPEKTLSNLCTKIGISFDPAMLSWQTGPKPEDGIWASHWYEAVWNSTGFAPPETDAVPALDGHLAELEHELRPDYDYMRNFALNA